MESSSSSSSAGYDGSYTAAYTPPYSPDTDAPTVVDHSLISLPPPTQYPGDLKSALEKTAAYLKAEDDTTDWEDPALAWLGFVRALQDKDPVEISRMIRLAKSSPHTTISFQAMIERGGFGLDVTYGRPGDNYPSDSEDEPLAPFVYTQGNNPDDDLGVGGSGIPLGE